MFLASAFAQEKRKPGRSQYVYTRYNGFIAYTRYARAQFPSMFTNVPAHIVAGKQAVATNRDAYNNSGPALTDSTTALLRVPHDIHFSLTTKGQS